MKKCNKVSNWIKVFRTNSGWWAVMTWDETINDYTMFWSGSKRTEDMTRVVQSLLKGA